MIQLFILGLLLYLGAKADRLRWQPFAWIAGSSLIACWLQSAMKADGRASLGEGPAALFDPQVFLANWAIGAALWTIFYLLGHAGGRLVRRWRKAD